VLRAALPLTSLAASALLLALGGARPLRALAIDAASLAILFAVLFALALGPLSRDAIGLLLVLAVVVRVGPSALEIATKDGSAPPTTTAGPHAAPPTSAGSLHPPPATSAGLSHSRSTTSAGSPIAAFLVAFALYAPLAAWVTAAAAPYGDQVHYLLAADRLSDGSLDATIDAALFRSFIGAELTDADRATHEIAAPAGPRSVQGPLLPALLLPGWLLAGRLGSHLVIALIAALAAAQLWLLLREAAPAGRAREVTWLAATFLAPALPLATHLYPNALGALLGVAAYRFAFTRAPALPLAAGALLGATLLLTPRDGLLLLALAPFVLRRSSEAGEHGRGGEQGRVGEPQARFGHRHRRRFVYGALAAALAAIALNGLVYGLPIPYAGYAFGTVAAQSLEQEPSFSFRFWVGLPAMLFDRTFGLAAVAPWAFVALAGLAPALRERRAVLLPAAAAIALTLAVLSLFRYWEGGYAPPARYLVEVMPLAAPFVAYGLTVVRWWLSTLLLALGALGTLVLAAIPLSGLNSAFEHKLREQVAAALGTDPLGWLPSFQPTTPDWYVGAYLRLIPAVLAVAVLVWLGRQRARA
jgi:hypothetical protein